MTLHIEGLSGVRERDCVGSGCTDKAVPGTLPSMCAKHAAALGDGSVWSAVGNALEDFRDAGGDPWKLRDLLRRAVESSAPSEPVADPHAVCRQRAEWDAARIRELSAMRENDPWMWEEDGENNLATLSSQCPILIMPRVLERLLAGMFYLERDVDASGVSGTGRVAQGFVFEDGTCALRWLTEHRSTAVYASVADVEAIHGHNGSTRIVPVGRAL